MKRTDESCLIVGAGISGLLAARELQRNGWRVTVVDKEREVGGRMATRRVGTGTFDHGAQFFTVRTERFGKLVEGWIQAGVVEEWTRGFADASGKHNEDGHPRYRGSHGMTSIPKHLARGLDVRTGERVMEIHARGEGWEVGLESGAQMQRDALLLTAPVPQSLALVESGNFRVPERARRELEEVSYGPCVALMALLDGPSGIPEPGGVQIKGEPLDWLGDNYRKGISASPAITIHAGPEWSREHFDASDEELRDALLSHAKDWLGSNIIETSVARWRYSWVTKPHPEPSLLATEDPPLLFAGDAFGQPKVEGAALSGLAAANRLLGRQS